MSDFPDDPSGQDDYRKGPVYGGKTGPEETEHVVRNTVNDPRPSDLEDPYRGLAPRQRSSGTSSH